MERRYGKHRGIVVDNVDPMGLVRLQVSVAHVFGDGVSAWAMPCVPFAGPGIGVVALPSPGSAVWVEFEEGDVGRPIWSGAFWSTPAEVPGLGDDDMVIAGAGGAQVRIGAGAVRLQASTEAEVTVGADEIVITNGAGASVDLVGDEVRIRGRLRRS